MVDHGHITETITSIEGEVHAAIAVLKDPQIGDFRGHIGHILGAIPLSLFTDQKIKDVHGTMFDFDCRSRFFFFMNKKTGQYIDPPTMGNEPFTLMLCGKVTNSGDTLSVYGKLGACVYL